MSPVLTAIPPSHPLRVLSWNVNGLTHYIKRKKVLSYLQSKRADIALLQETHLNDLESSKLQHDWVGRVIYSSHTSPSEEGGGPSRKCGVAILLRKSLSATIIKTWSDAEGRYVFAKLKIGARVLCVGSVYAPTGIKRSFLLGLNRTITEIGASQYLIGGDWNLTRDAIMDRTGPVDSGNNADRVLLDDVIKDHVLTDHWRLTHPTEKDYTFLSPVHGTQSRLDYFLVSHKLIATIQDSRILPAALSDHAPISTSLNMGTASPGRKPWRMPIHRYRAPQGRSQLQEHVSTYFETNAGSVTSQRVLWAASKATVRGQLMRDAALANAQRVAKQVGLEDRIRTLTRLYTSHPTPTTRHDLEVTKMELNTLNTSKAEFALRAEERR